MGNRYNDELTKELKDIKSSDISVKIKHDFWHNKTS